MKRNLLNCGSLACGLIFLMMSTLSARAETGEDILNPEFFSASPFHFEMNRARVRANETLYALVHVTGDALDAGDSVDLLLSVGEKDVITGLAIYTNGKPTSFYPIADIASSKGVVLVSKSNKKVMTLSAPDFDLVHGGIAKLTYLYNGIKNEYREFMIQIVGEHDSYYVMDINQGKHNRVSKFYLKKNAQFPFGTIGIAEIIASP